MKDKHYFVDEVYGALVIIKCFVKDAPYILDCTNGMVLRDALGMALAGGINNVAKRLVADRERRSNAEPATSRHQLNHPAHGVVMRGDDNRVLAGRVDLAKEKPMRRLIGTFIKQSQPRHLERLENAKLRDVGYDEEGYYLKIDCDAPGERSVQLYIYLDEIDAERVVNNWRQANVHILCRGCEWYESCPGPEPFPPSDCSRSGGGKENNR